jgi:hypothetical protein
MECNLPGMGELSCAERSGATFTGMCCDNLSASHDYYIISLICFIYYYYVIILMGLSGDSLSASL